MKKKTFLIVVCFLLLFVSIFSKTFFEKGLCGFYNSCEWIAYFFVVPTTYIIASLFIRSTKPFKFISAITLGIFISILLNRDWTTSFIIQKLFATLFGSLITYIIVKQFAKNEKL